jgi:hypothetical protein
MRMRNEFPELPLAKEMTCKSRSSTRNQSGRTLSPSVRPVKPFQRAIPRRAERSVSRITEDLTRDERHEYAADYPGLNQGTMLRRGGSKDLVNTG